VGKKQSRAAGKRQHQPTNRLGVNVAIKEKHVIYATANRSLQDNRKLLMVSGAHSTHSTNAASSAQVFPVGVLSESLNGELPESGDPISSLVPAVNDSQLPIGIVGIHQQNADVAAPFAVGLGDGGNGGDDDDSSSSYRQTSDNGAADNHSMSSSVRSDYDNNTESANLPPDSDVNFAYLEGHHSDLFETLFQTLPIDDSKYRSPGTTSNCLSGPLLFSPRDHSSTLSDCSCPQIFTIQLLNSALNYCTSIGGYCMALMRCLT
jgi:hypothetical protein